MKSKKNIEFYATHKYTKVSGGHQDNQYKDIQEFIKESVTNTYTDKYFIAICDGDFYNTKNSQRGISKLENLQRLAVNNFSQKIDRI